MTAILIALIPTIPAIISAVATLTNGRRLKRTSERIKAIHAAIPNGNNGAASPN